ncbi:MAG: hypothetical protein R2706_08915 [Acidimicrobiales bacterium]
MTTRPNPVAPTDPAPATTMEDTMDGFVITLSNDRTERVEQATGYQAEGPMTTFFSNESTRNVLDSWSTRYASYRTTEIVAIRRLEAA